MYSKFESKIIVRPSDIDYNGHVHHSIYFDYVLAARLDQMKRCYKMSMSEFSDNGWSWMVRSYSIEYKRPIKISDFALVRTWIHGIGDPEAGKKARSISTVNFEIEVSSTKKLAALGKAVYVMVDFRTGRPVAIPDFVIERYSI